MRYYVDCEFNGNEGQLLSIALVRQDGAEFYAALDVFQLPQPWVRENVMPVLHTQMPNAAPNIIDRVHAETMSREDCKKSLRKFLEKDGGLHTYVGDWPEDIVHFCNLLLRDHGKRNPPVQFRCLVLDLPGFNTADHSATPHNALDDARVLRAFVEQGYKDGRGGELSLQDLALLQGT